MKKIGFFFVFFYIYGLLFSGEVYKEIIPGRHIVLDEEGYFFSDYGNHNICKYSKSGMLLLRIGKKGEGPSDIKRLGWFEINPKDKAIYVTEYFGGNKWISKFSKNGQYLGEWKCNLDWNKWKALRRIKFDKKGNAYIEVERTHRKQLKDILILGSEFAILKFSANGTQTGELYKFKSETSLANKMTQVTIPFHNEFHFEIFNGKLIIIENNSEFVGIYNTDGQLEKKISIPLEREKLEEQDKDNWKEDLKSSRWAKRGIAAGWLDLDYWFDRMPYPEFKPVSDGMVIDPDGFLYIEKYNRFKKGKIIWVRIDLSTGKSTILKSKPDEYLTIIRGNNLYIKHYDENEDVVFVKTDKGKYFIE